MSNKPDKFDCWTIMSPSASLRFVGGGSDLFIEDMQRIPGVKFKYGSWQVPYNAVSVVNGICQRHAVSIASASWKSKPGTVPTWDSILPKLANEVRPQYLADFPTPFQKDAICYGWNRTGVHYWHSTGAGKTYTALLSALSLPGLIVFVTKSSARVQVAREVARFTIHRAYVVRPKSALQRVTVQGMTYSEYVVRFSPASPRKSWEEFKNTNGIDPVETIADYLVKCKNTGARPILVAGWDTLVDHLQTLTALKPSTLIADELHRGKGRKRWDVVSLPVVEHISELDPYRVEAEEQGGFVKLDEDTNTYKMFLPVLNMAAAAARLSRHVRKRIGTTASPISDRVRDLWSQLDVIEPNSWGNATAWQTRYADRRPGPYGGFDTKGSSRLPELKERIKWCAHILRYEETHKDLPAKRRQSFYIAPEDQCAPEPGFAKELSAALKSGGSVSVVEVRLAEAASRKRKAVLAKVEEHIASGHKICIFTARRRDCHKMAAEVRKLDATEENGATILEATGDLSVEARQAIVDEYMARSGPCVLVATGQSLGESLNLNTTDAAFFVMLPYTPGQLRQWEGRFMRLGTLKPVIIYYCIAENTVDEHVASILIEKLPAVEKIAQDVELGAAKAALGGIQEMSDEAFAESILSFIDE